LTVDVRVIDHRREKVDGLNQGQIVGEPIDPGVVVGLGADEDVGVVASGQVAQNLRQPLGGQLARSAGTRGIVNETFFAAEEQHAESLLGSSYREGKLLVGRGGTGYFFRRWPTALTAHSSSGNSPVLSFEYSRSPLRLSSKQPPLDGISFSSRICCLYVARSLLVRLTACGS
jgi:hypothetical protein